MRPTYGYTYRVLAVTSWAATPPQPSPATGADAPCEGGGEPAGLLATTGFAALLVSAHLSGHHPGIFVGHKWPTCVYAPMTGFVGDGASPTLHAARCWLSAYLSGHHPGVFVGHAVGYTYRELAVTSWAATPPQPSPSPATGADAPCEGGGEPAGLLATTGFAALLVSAMNGRPAFIPS